MHDERPDETVRPESGAESNTEACHHDALPTVPVPHDHATSHPAILRLHAELEAAREGMAAITRSTLPNRGRIVEEIRTGLPDIAGRAAHEAGADATVAEIRRFTRLGVEHRDDACPVVLLWGEILDTATVAASAVR
jgi:hypothetical protein